MILQVTVCSPEGIDPNQLAQILSRWYRLPSGRKVYAQIGSGLHLDGIPTNTIVLAGEDFHE